MKEKSKIIVVDRTQLNVRVAILSNKEGSKNEIYAATKVLKRVWAEEKKFNKPIMNISMELSEAEMIFSKEDIEKKSFICSV